MMIQVEMSEAVFDCGRIDAKMSLYSVRLRTDSIQIISEEEYKC